jgi:cytochrome P450
MIVRPVPPGPKGHWLLGSLAEFRRDELGFYARLAREYGDVAAYRLGTHRFVLVSHPELVEQVLVRENHNFARNFVFEVLRPTLGNGLLLSEGPFWLRQRRLMQPAFSRQRVESYGAEMVRHTLRLAEQFKDGQTRDLHADMMRLTLAIVAEALLGAETGAVSEVVGEALHVIMRDFDERLGSLFPPPRWLPTPGNLRLRRAVRRLDAIIGGIIAERRAAPEGRDDLLAELVRARDEDDGRGMTDRQLRDEVMTLFLAGHETTANALSWALYLLAQNPAAEAALRHELASVLGDRPPAVADLPRLRYAEAVFKESMRLYPPVDGTVRRAVETCLLGGYHVPAGTNVLLSQWNVHRDPRWYGDADAFRPERWLDGSTERLPKYAYFPFGGGPRLCIGQGFAMIEGTLVLAALLPRCRFTLVPDHPVKPWPSITLRPAHGIKAVVRPVPPPGKAPTPRGPDAAPAGSTPSPGPAEFGR